jgi:hypothetical protein
MDTLAKQLIREAISTTGTGDLFAVTTYLEKKARHITASRANCERVYRFLDSIGLKTTGDIKKVIAEIKAEGK